MTQTIAIIIAIAVLATYTVTLCVVNRGVPDSLSATVFNLPPAGKWLWTAVIAGVGFTSMPVFIDAASENTKFLAFFACGGLMAVGLCPLVRDRLDAAYKIHMAGAYVSAAASQACVALNHWQVLLLWIPWAIAFVWITKDRRWESWKFWAQMTCFAVSFAFVMA